ncbi:MAG: hypothetical protein WAP55_02560 [Minisyncoccia bacterium]
MGWYLMYRFHPQGDDGIARYKFRIIGVPTSARDQTTYAKATEIGRCIWRNIIEESASDPDEISSPEIVWRFPLESIQDDPVEAIPVDSGIHQPDETAER